MAGLTSLRPELTWHDANLEISVVPVMMRTRSGTRGRRCQRPLHYSVLSQHLWLPAARSRSGLP